MRSEIISWCKLTLMIFVMTEEVPESRGSQGVTHRRWVWGGEMFFKFSCYITLGVYHQTGGGDSLLWEGGNTHSVEWGHKDTRVSPITPMSTLEPHAPPLLSARGGQCWQVNPAGNSPPLLTRNTLVHFISSVCFNLPKNVNFAPGNFPMSGWQPNTHWHHQPSQQRHRDGDRNSSCVRYFIPQVKCCV